MSLKIGTNLDYRGHDFLDSRQSHPQSTDDLRDWDYSEFPVPLGFEACVDTTWYTYMGPDYTDEETGRWKRRGGAYDEDSELREDVNKLLAHCFPAKLTVSGGGTYVKGESVTPSISWTLLKDRVLVPIVSTWIQVDNNDWEVQSSNATTWSPTSPITSGHTYKVKVRSDEGGEFIDQTSYSFVLETYWDAVENPGPQPNLTVLARSGKASKSTKTKITYDCSGGRYPMIILPASKFHQDTFQMWIGGLLNSNWDFRTVTLENEKGSSDSYTIVWLQTRQTGASIEIEFKNI